LNNLSSAGKKVDPLLKNKSMKKILIAACAMAFSFQPLVSAAQTSSRRYAPASEHLVNYSSYASASHGDPGGSPDVPIDGGISFLIAAGAAYGAKKIRDGRRKKENIN
jgi:hypothetical protein